MANEQAFSADTISSSIGKNGGSLESLRGGGVFSIQCFGPNGVLKWSEKSKNLVVNVGLQDMTAKYFAGSSYTAAWYLGIYGASATNNPSASDTMASHVGWTEITSYSQPTRPACTFGLSTETNPSVISNSALVASFLMTSSTTVGGAFLTSNNTKGGSTGILFSAADFGSPGDRVVTSGDTISVTYTFSLAAA